MVACLFLGIRARRDETQKEADFGYGTAVGAGTLISLVASFLSSVFAYVYYAFINPAFTDLMVQAQMAKMEARGMSGDQLEKAEAMTKWMMSAGTGVRDGLLLPLHPGSHPCSDRRRVPEAPGAEHARGRLGNKKGPDFSGPLNEVSSGRLPVGRPFPFCAVVDRHDDGDSRHAEEPGYERVCVEVTERKQDCGNGENRRGSRSDDGSFHMMYSFVCPLPYRQGGQNSTPQER